MQWVQTTGRSVDEAKDRALDQLGVDESEAEFEVLEEPKAGLFGRVRGEARIKARVRPETPRPKTERRRRRSGRSGSGGAREGNGKGRGGGGERAGGGRGGGGDRPRQRNQGGRGGGPKQRQPQRDRRPKERAGSDRSKGGPKQGPDGGAEMTQDLDNAQQGEIVAGFVEGLLEAFGAEGEVATEEIDDEMVEVRVEGDDLGLLIGPKGRTLWSIQELARTVVQRHAAGGRQDGRVRVDVAGYRELRRRSLAEFTRGVADQVLAAGEARSLEPMGAADRKVVHDTVNEIEGVGTVSEGEDPRRRVVIVPESSDD